MKFLGALIGPFRDYAQGQAVKPGRLLAFQCNRLLLRWAMRYSHLAPVQQPAPR
jgi:hypothetical protein